MTMPTITDEMIERACMAFWWAVTLDSGLSPQELEGLTPEGNWEDIDKDNTRKHMRAALEAALKGE